MVLSVILQRLDSMDGWFQWYFRYWLGRKASDDQRQIKRWKGIVSRFKGILIKMIKDVDGKFDDYFISSKIRQILLQWGYELLGLCDYFFVNIKMINVLIEKNY